MPNTGLNVFDTTLHKTNEWLRDVGEELHTEDRQECYRTLRAVLHTLRDRLIVDEAVHLGAQLPMLLRGVYYEGWSPARTPTDDDREAFLDRVREGMSDQPGVPDPERWTRAVFAVLSRHVDEGELEDVVHLLPEGLGELWPEAIRS